MDQKIKVDGIDSKGIPWCLDRGSGDQYSDWSTCYPNLAVDPNDIMRHPSSSPNFADYYINPVRPILPPPWDPYGYGASRNRLVSATQPAPWGQPTQTNNSAATDTNTQQGQNPADRHKTCECSLDDHEKLFCAKKDVKCNTIPLPARASEYDGEIFYDTCHPPTSCSEQREEWNAQPGLGARTCECIDKANGQKRAWCKKSRFQCTWIPTSARGNVIYCQIHAVPVNTSTSYNTRKRLTEHRLRQDPLLG
ncbi:Putative protein of unknown function [Podospora comata]|uniref:Uncharacterized protein n=1 Tax=Podospora comata TaxID=48703 RepID=A0ABY6SGW5_PODCO|nr:Putative protein of unknown function [Podospora comata]